MTVSDMCRKMRIFLSRAWKVDFTIFLNQKNDKWLGWFIQNYPDYSELFAELDIIDDTDPALVYNCVKYFVYQNIDYEEFAHFLGRNCFDNAVEYRIQTFLDFFNFVMEKERSYAS